MAESEATDSDTGGPAPPGLHEAADESRECGNCTYYRSSGNECTKFPPLCVSPDWLCGAWKASGRDTGTDDRMRQPPTSPIRTATRQQFANLRLKRQGPAQP
jgi:hypothetical protein